MLRDLIDSILGAFRSIYWNVAETLSALNPFPSLFSLLRELWDLLDMFRRGLGSFFRWLIELPRLLGSVLYQVGRYILLMPLEIAALLGIGKSRLGWRESLPSPIAAVGQTIGGISETVAEFQPTEVGARLTAETRDVSYALFAGIRKALGTIVWAPFALLYFLYDLVLGIGALPGRIKDAIVNRTKKQLAIAAAFVAFSGVCLFGVYNLWTTSRARHHTIATHWHEFDMHLRFVDPVKALASLEQLEALLPNDPTVRKRLEQLRTGKPAADDLTVLRMYMRKALADKDLPKAAELAKTLVDAQPNDWEGNLILAHRAIVDKKPDEARRYAQNLPEPDRVSGGIGPGGIIYAAQVLREIKATEQLDKAIDYFIYRILPVANSYEVEKWAAPHKLQLIEGYLLSMDHLGRRPGLASYWVPVQRLCRWVLEDGSLDAEGLARLGMSEEAQLSALQAFRTRKLIEEKEFAELVREVEARLKIIWDEVLKRDPKSVRAYTAKALARHRANDLAGAVALLDQGIAACGPKVELVSTKSQLLRQSDPTQGFEFARASVQNDPNSVQLKAILAETSIKAGRLDEALEACRQAIALEPNLEWANRLTGQICLEMKRPTEAIIAYRRIPKVVLNDPQAAAEYVRALGSLGLSDEMDKFIAGIDLADDRSGDVVAQCCNSLIRMNKSELALKHVRALLAKRPAHVAGRLIHADLLRMSAEKGADWDVELARQSIDEYRTILIRDPNNLAVVNNVAWLELKALKQPEQAMRTAGPLRVAEAGHTISPEMLETLGAIYSANDQPEKARTALSRAIARGSPRASFFINLSEVYLQLRLVPQAELYFTRARQFPMTPMEQRDFRELAIRIRGNK